MQLGKTLVGAIIGAALGIGLLLAIYFLFEIDTMWLAIPVAVLTGLGVRLMVATSGHVSYLRGAITAVLGLAAYIGGFQISSAVRNYRAAQADKERARAIQQQPADAGEVAKAPETEPAKANPEAPAPTVAQTPAGGAVARRAPANGGYSPQNFIALAVAAFLAYELGRGSGGVRSSDMPAEPSEPTPAGTHPDA
jgi:hypothetical protein